MKKLLILLFSVMLVGSAFSNSCVAADVRNNVKTCVLVIGDADVKAKDFMSILEDCFNENNDMGKKSQLSIGTEVQSKYQEYWFEQGFLEEQKLTKQDLHNFVKYSNYDQCLYLIVSNPSTEKTKIPAGWFTTAENTRASIQINAFLADNTNVIKTLSVTKNDDSRASELRAKRGAFKKCVKEIANRFKAILYN